MFSDQKSLGGPYVAHPDKMWGWPYGLGGPDRSAQHA